MRERLLTTAVRFWPELASVDGKAQTSGVGTVWTTLYAAPLAFIALLWLVAQTDLTLLTTHWPFLLLLFVLWGALAQFDFSGVLDIEYLPARGSQGRLIIWSAALLFGPTMLWLGILGSVVDSIRWWRRAPATGFMRQYQAWFLTNNLLVTIARETLSGLVALWFYRQWGGGFPLAGVTPEAILPALYATLVKIALFVLIIAPIFVVYLYAEKRPSIVHLLNSLVRFWLTVIIFYILPEPFGVLAAGFYAQNGLWIYLFFLAGLFITLALAQQLSKMAVRSQRRSYELSRLEQLAQALLREPIAHIDLAQLLAGYIPLIFDESQIEIRLFPDRVLYRDNAFHLPLADEVWRRLPATVEPYLLWENVTQEGGRRPLGDVLAVPIVAVGEGAKIGGIYIYGPEHARQVLEWLPVAQSLAGQISAVVHQMASHEQALASQAEAYQKEVYVQAYQAEVYSQALAYQKVSQELALAGQIQASFLPRDLPDVPGWQLAVTLEPARETSGDFYDFIPLSNGRLGIVVADVADKGVGAALYMALSRTLIRTFAQEHSAEPEKALAAANQRILADTGSDLFVTVFYAILDPQTGVLTYCNAGHNPPFLLRSQNGHEACPLSRTALPLGLFEDLEWTRTIVEIMPGDVLVLYTDGVTEAQDETADFFGEERLKAVAWANLGRSAEVIESKMLAAIYDFVGDEPQFDDITLMILFREA